MRIMLGKRDIFGNLRLPIRGMAKKRRLPLSEPTFDDRCIIRGVG